MTFSVEPARSPSSKLEISCSFFSEIEFWRNAGRLSDVSNLVCIHTRFRTIRGYAVTNLGPKTAHRTVICRWTDICTYGHVFGTWYLFWWFKVCMRCRSTNGTLVLIIFVKAPGLTPAARPIRLLTFEEPKRVRICQATPKVLVTLTFYYIIAPGFSYFKEANENPLAHYVSIYMAYTFETPS